MSLHAATPTTPTASPQPAGSLPAPPYQPGVCNIGPAEIARRRTGAIVATVLTVVVAVVVFALGWPHVVRIIIALPAAAGIVSWLQVVLGFCVGFAQMGVFNFGEVGPTVHISDHAAHHADLQRARLMIAGAIVGGLIIGIVAVFLP